MPVILAVPFAPVVQPFDRVHMENLTISVFADQKAKSELHARIRLYSQDANGVKTFSPDFQDINILDAEAWAVGAATSGDVRGVQAVQHITELVALLVETHTGLGNAVAV